MQVVGDTLQVKQTERNAQRTDTDVQSGEQWAVRIEQFWACKAV